MQISDNDFLVKLTEYNEGHGFFYETVSFIFNGEVLYSELLEEDNSASTENENERYYYETLISVDKQKNTIQLDKTGTIYDYVKKVMNNVTIS